MLRVLFDIEEATEKGRRDEAINMRLCNCHKNVLNPKLQNDEAFSLNKYYDILEDIAQNRCDEAALHIA